MSEFVLGFCGLECGEVCVYVLVSVYVCGGVSILGFLAPAPIFRSTTPSRPLKSPGLGGLVVMSEM